jgi:hypothetical protein
MSKNFDKLKKLEQERKVTLGINKNHANNFWSNQTIIGKILNWITNLLIIVIIIVFIKFGFIWVILAIIGTGIYSVIIQKMAGWYVREILLNDEELFNAAYQARSVTVRDNRTGYIVAFPSDWADIL